MRWPTVMETLAVSAHRRVERDAEPVEREPPAADAVAADAGPPDAPAETAAEPEAW